MKKRGLIIVFCFLILGLKNINAQQVCECSAAKAVVEEIDEKLKKADFNSLATQLKKIPLKDEVCKASYYLQKLKIAFKEEKFDDFESDLTTVNQIFKKLNCKDLELEVLKLGSNYYSSKANYPKLLDNDIRILNILEQQKNDLGTANSLLNIANTLNRLSNPEKGIIYTRRAVTITQKLPDSLSKTSILNKITASYLWYGQDFKSQKHLDSAKYFAEYALKLAQKFKAKIPQVSALIRLNAVAQEKGQYQQAIQYLNKALALCNPRIDFPQLASIYSDKANLYKLLNNYNKAIVFADSSLFFNKKFNYPPLIANAYHGVYEIEQLRGNYKEALNAFQKEKEITDSLTTSEKNLQVTELEQKYNKVRNEKIINTLSQEKKISNLQLSFLGAISILLIIIAVLGFLVFRQRALKQKHYLLAAEQRLNRSRINPHFFFNALTTLQGMALNKDDGKSLAIKIASFSKIMRQTLESTYTEYVDLKIEVAFLKEYLELQLLNDPQKFGYQIIYKDVEDDEYLVPVMILQPFIENAIEHGFANINYKGEIVIIFRKENNQLVVSITDNGCGINIKPKNQASRATQIITDRLLLINQEKKSNARFVVESKESGTSITLFLPLILDDESISN